VPEIAAIWTSAGGCRHQPCDPETFRRVERETPYPRPPRELEGSETHGFQGGAASIYRLAPGKQCWFHFPLIAPASLGEHRTIYLDRVMLLFETTADCAITWATLQHGGLQRHELTERYKAIAGYHAEALDADNTFLIRPRLKVDFGLQLSVQVTAGEGEGQIAFYSVGGAFWNEPLS
jgi:hypothetical protein